MARNKGEFEIIKNGPVFKKSNSGGIKISLIAIDGNQMFDVRQVYKQQGSDDWFPTPKGFTLPPDKAAKVLKKFLSFIKDNQNAGNDDN